MFIPVVVGCKLRDYNCFSGDPPPPASPPSKGSFLESSENKPRRRPPSRTWAPCSSHRSTAWRVGLCLTQGGTWPGLPTVGAQSGQAWNCFSSALSIRALAHPTPVMLEL